MVLKMKSSLYLESTTEEQGYDGDHGLDHGGLSGMSEPWMSPVEGSVSFPRLDGSPYAASLVSIALHCSSLANLL